MIAPFDASRIISATSPPEWEGRERSDVRLLVSRSGTIEHRRFRELGQSFRPGDLLVVNESSAWPASLPADAEHGRFRVNLSTEYGDGIWLVEPRVDSATPGPLPLRAGEEIRVGGLPVEVLEEFPGVPRLRFVRFGQDAHPAIWQFGEPIRYGYSAGPFPLSAYQTVFSRRPWSAEMPSASRPFSRGIVRELLRAGVRFTPVVLHAGVSSFDAETPGTLPVVYPEPFEVPERTARAIERTRRNGGRVVAIGTTVLRALESAYRDGAVRSAAGFTSVRVDPNRPVRSVDALLSGFHNSGTSHLAMLEAVLGRAELERAYDAAIQERYRWHEFGDAHLMFRPTEAMSPAAG
ncbi:MAG: S-adenosylmethionine:tRNA ribosyltransferase-isomerase [Thermoplasmata archaeon]|nr:S-adenosylmethionine:tRNA ribosyltransferase-isomerase [Thermoplasmata archaeon]